MNRAPRDVERELTERLQASAPQPRPGTLDRALARVAATSQRRSWRARLGAASDHASLGRPVAMAGVVVIALAVGLGYARLGLPLSIAPIASPLTSSARPVPASPSASDEASPTSLSDGSVTRSAEEHGIRLTATLDRDRTTFGQRLWAEALVENVGSNSAWWRHLGMCPWPVEITVAPETPTAIDEGRDDWPGPLGILKGSLIADEQPVLSDRRRSFVPEERVDSGSIGCFTVLNNEELPEGASISHRAAWDTDDFMGMPSVPGRYTVEATFELWRGAAPEGPPFDTEPMTVRVEFPLVVEGPDVDWISPGVAIDALLSDDRFLALLAEAPPVGRGGAMAFRNETWIVRHHVATSDTDLEPVATLVGVIDARTGAVLDVRLEDYASDDSY